MVSDSFNLYWTRLEKRFSFIAGSFRVSIFSLVHVTRWGKIFLQPFIISFPYLLELSNWPRSGNYDFKKNEKCLKVGFNRQIMLQGLGDTAVDLWEVDETAQQMSGLCSEIRTDLRVRSHGALSDSDAKNGWNAHFFRWQLSIRAQCLFTRTVSVSVSVKVYHCVNGNGPFDGQNGFQTHSYC